MSLIVKWFQNGFKIVIDLFGETVWKECLHLKVVCIFAKVTNSDTPASDQK